ncbi:hypothetical protein CJ030_MR7G009251 [Morella rubra]|uniref:Uncharacterized protein n=1 Tax=Morella rubra TaxID=262757 RepID=A0A6A1V049_9ROSI|nr:hypothetical protein CJ030_MR7G009251 [Morella rubra]
MELVVAQPLVGHTQCAANRPRKKMTPRHLACNYFEWIDPPHSAHGEDAIASMVRKMKIIEEKMKIMEQERKIMDEELRKLKAKERQLRFMLFGT